MHTAHNLVTEESPDFREIDERVRTYRPRVNYDVLSFDIRAMINKVKRGEKAHLTLVYYHSQMSNVISALRRRDLDVGVDYRITKSVDERDGEEIETLIISAP